MVPVFIPCSSQGVCVSQFSGVFGVHTHFCILNTLDRTGIHRDLWNVPSAVYPGVTQHFHPHPYLKHPPAPWGSQDKGLRWVCAGFFAVLGFFPCSCTWGQGRAGRAFPPGTGLFPWQTRCHNLLMPFATSPLPSPLREPSKIKIVQVQLNLGKTLPLDFRRCSELKIPMKFL